MGAREKHAQWEVPGLVIRRIERPVGIAADRVEAALRERGIELTARIDHAVAAAGAALALPPTIVLVFGNPRVGTALMTATPTIAIDLPLKLLLWETADGLRWVGYNDPFWIAQRHSGTTLLSATLRMMSDLLARLSTLAAE